MSTSSSSNRLFAASGNAAGALGATPNGPLDLKLPSCNHARRDDPDATICAATIGAGPSSVMFLRVMEWPGALIMRRVEVRGPALALPPPPPPSCNAHRDDARARLESWGRRLRPGVAASADAGAGSSDPDVCFKNAERVRMLCPSAPPPWPWMLRRNAVDLCDTQRGIAPHVMSMHGDSQARQWCTLRGRGRGEDSRGFVAAASDIQRRAAGVILGLFSASTALRLACIHLYPHCRLLVRVVGACVAGLRLLACLLLQDEGARDEWTARHDRPTLQPSPTTHL